MQLNSQALFSSVLKKINSITSHNLRQSNLTKGCDFAVSEKLNKWKLFIKEAKLQLN